jgi:hypothetical protein
VESAARFNYFLWSSGMDPGSGAGMTGLLGFSGVVRSRYVGPLLSGPHAVGDDGIWVRGGQEKGGG